jgi:hypothetical protein
MGPTSCCALCSIGAAHAVRNIKNEPKLIRIDKIVYIFLMFPPYLNRFFAQKLGNMLSRCLKMAVIMAFSA